MIELVVIGLSVVWLLAGAGKLATPRTAATFLTGLFPRLGISGATVRGFAVLEVLLSVGLVTPATQRLSAVASTVGSLGFCALLALSYRHSRGSLACGCFGSLTDNRAGGPWQVVLVAAMLCGSVVLSLATTPTEYLGLYGQSIAVLLIVVVIGGRYLRLRRATIYGESTGKESL
ncbi:MauE/DoxX family redox-associated membrane protein [Fodinicola acaciae]|uniref:MauE/DoxX family redox-associated membrane protein n=1 Tax=Fodinicola acaciae TaxID=2681555 RepID=UPI0013D729D9|nr:MauE/DoxX family redox-associated membrane protein [Fodinicola acaciae]